MNESSINIFAWLKCIIVNPTTLAILCWVGGAGGIVFIMKILVKFAKNCICQIKKTALLKNIFIDDKSIRLFKELSDEGIVNFFPYPQTYMEYKDHGKPSEYVKLTTEKLVYVGFWLTHSIGLGDMLDSIKALLNRGVEISLVFMNPFNKGIIEYCHSHFGLDYKYIESEFDRAIKSFYQFYQSTDISENEKKQLHLKLHSEHLSASAFLIDWDDVHCGKILVDTKIRHTEFSNGYGLELKNNPNINERQGSLYNRMKKSYLAFIDNGGNNSIKTIDIPIDVKNSIAQIIETIQSKANEH